MSDLKETVIHAFGKKELKNKTIEKLHNHGVVEIIKSKFEKQSAIKPELQLNESENNMRNSKKKLNYTQTLGNRMESVFGFRF